MVLLYTCNYTSLYMLCIHVLAHHRLQQQLKLFTFSMKCWCSKNGLAETFFFLSSFCQLCVAHLRNVIETWIKIVSVFKDERKKMNQSGFCDQTKVQRMEKWMKMIGEREKISIFRRSTEVANPIFEDFARRWPGKRRLFNTPHSPSTTTEKMNELF